MNCKIQREFVPEVPVERHAPPIYRFVVVFLNSHVPPVAAKAFQAVAPVAEAWYAVLAPTEVAPLLQSQLLPCRQLTR